MPKGQRPSKSQLAQLARLPRQDGLTLIGSKRVLPLYVRERRQTFQPEMALWLDEQSGYIRASRVFSPHGGEAGVTAEALESLIEACTGPFLLPQPSDLIEDDDDEQPRTKRGRKRKQRPPSPHPALPARVLVDDAALALAAQATLAPYNVAVEHIEHAQMLDEAFAALTESLSLEMDTEPPQPFTWDIDEALLPPLYKVAAGIWRRAPWDYMPDHPPIAVALGERGPEPGVETLYVSVLGGGGEVIGLAFYYSLDAFAKTLARGAELRAPATAEEVDDEDVDLLIGMLRQIGAPVDAMPPQELRTFVGETLAEEFAAPENPWEISPNGMVCFFDAQDVSDVMYLEWLEDHNLKYPSRDGVPSFLRTLDQSEPRRPNKREVRALTLTIEALNQFFSRHGRVLDNPLASFDTLTHRARISDDTETIAVDVTYPPPGYTLENEDIGVEKWVKEGRDDE